MAVRQRIKRRVKWALRRVVSRANPWVERVLDAALDDELRESDAVVAQGESDAVVDQGAAATEGAERTPAVMSEASLPSTASEPADIGVSQPQGVVSGDSGDVVEGRTSDYAPVVDDPDEESEPPPRSGPWAFLDDVPEDGDDETALAEWSRLLEQELSDLEDELARTEAQGERVDESSPDAEEASAGAAPRVDVSQEVRPPMDDDEKGRVEEQALEVVQTIFDPEIPVNIYELGLIYGIDVKASRHVDVTMTLTSPNCPAAQSLPGEVETKIGGLEGVDSVSVDVVFEPAWDPSLMSEAARLELNL